MNRLTFSRLINEPLLHFLVAGGVLFFVFARLNPEPSKTTIELPQSARKQFVVRYEQARGASPGAAELARFEQSWIREEVLFRKGVELGLDQHDAIIRNRVIEKMQMLFSGAEDLVQPEDNELQSFLEQHAERYREAARYSFSLLEIPDDAAQGGMLLAALNNGAEPRVLGLPVHEARQQNEATILAVWGQEAGPALLSVLESVQSGEVSKDDEARWHQVRTAGKTVLIQLQGKSEASLPKLESVRNRVIADWRKFRRQQQVELKVTELMQDYEVVLAQEAVSEDE